MLPVWATPRLPAAVYVVVLACALRLLYGVGDPGYDSAYALMWGHDLTEGRLPDYEAQGSPTPHPLWNVVLAPVSLLDDRAWDVSVLLVYVAYAALGWGAYALGRAIFSAPVGVAFAAILLTRPLLVSETLEAFVDLPFLALVVWAAALEARAPRRGAVVLVLLGLAGLLRPEAWLFSGAYALYLLPGASPRERARIVALAALAPVLWLASDWVITGDPLYSLHGTQDIAQEIRRPRGLETAIDVLSSYLANSLRPPLFWASLGGALIGVWAMYRRSLIPAAIVAIGLIIFLAIGYAELALLARYLLPSAVGLALFAAVAVAGWTAAERIGAWRRAWLALAAVVVLFVALDAPATEDLIVQQRDLIERRNQVNEDLRRLVRDDPARTVALRCPPTRVEESRMIPAVTLALGVERSRVAGRPRGRRGSGTLIRPATQEAARIYLLGPQRFVDEAFGSRSRRLSLRLGPPAGYVKVTGNRSWVLYEAC